ncbi:MAG: hypothetical protein P8Q97_18175 [Myxococcota bacterium]|jgi:hypothetical protein|nr:hypothetical protein [Myxococcota bacterium]
MRPFVTSLLLLVLLTLSVGCASNPAQKGSHALIQINNMNVAPRIAKVSGPKNSVVWTNWSSSVASIHFPTSIADAFVCDELRPLFVHNGNTVESVTTVGDNESLSTPCPLKPGTYTYEVWLSQSQAQRENPQLKLTGQIVVATE